MAQCDRTSWIVLGRKVGLVSLLIMTTLFGLSIVSAFVGSDHYRGVVRDAVTSGVLETRVRLPFDPATPNFALNFNDCLILSMLVLPDDPDILARAVSPSVPSIGETWSGTAGPGYPDFVQCRNLAMIMDATPGATIPSTYYHQYIHGDWIITKLLLALFSLGLATKFIALILVGVLGALVVFSSRSALVQPGMTGRDLGYAIIGFVLLMFYALPIYARSFSFAPSDIVLSCFLLHCYIRPTNFLTESKLAVTSGAFGALTAIFEFLTGGIPSGVMAIIAIIVLDHSSNSSVMVRRLCIGMICFILAIGMCFAMKYATVLAMWGFDGLGSAREAMGRHLGHANWQISTENFARLQNIGLGGLSIEVIQSSRIFSYFFALSKIFYFTKQLAFGSVGLALIIIILLPLILFLRQLFLIWMCPNKAECVPNLLIVGACCVMPIWYFVLIEHTIVHANFMCRPMVWPLALLLAAQVQPWSGRFTTETDDGHSAEQP